MSKKLFFSLCFLIIIALQYSVGQNVVRGIVKDVETGDPLIGVNVSLIGTVRGTITNLDGRYELTSTERLPYRISFSFIGFETREVVVTEANATIDIDLIQQSVITSEVVVSASRVEESILESPVTIEKLDLIALRNSTAVDFYDEVSRLKGVHTVQASMTFNSVNARGFAGHGNTRFVQLMDGMDNAAPLLNFPTGNIVGISELDIKDMELIPGAASALYGPNAFNGILLMNSKDPFNYQGLSAQIKTGYTEGNVNSDPLYGGSFRYAKAIKDKFAFKINFSSLLASDWDANDYTTQRSLDLTGNLTPDHPAFDGINTYGDETLIPIGGGIRRTGWREEDLLESRDARSIKADAAVHYRLSDRIEINLSHRYGTGSTVYQGSERYALRDFVQQFTKLELNAADWNIRAYRSKTDAGNSYNLTALGAFINEGIFPSNQVTVMNFQNMDGGMTPVPVQGGWALASGIAATGNLAPFIPTLTPGNFVAAKQFADAGGFSLINQAHWPTLAPLIGRSIYGMNFPNLTNEAFAQIGMEILRKSSGNARPEVGSDAFNQIAEAVRTGLFQAGGAGFIDDSSLSHIEGNYNFSNLFDNKISLQVGGNFRRYDLFTMGTVFNEDPDGTGNFNRITIDEFGGYMQLIKKMADDRLKVTASLRYDKNQNFDGQVTPRASMVYSAGANRNHNFRASYQTGFRNPTTQNQFIYFPTTNILLGGTRENAERYGIYNGGAWTDASYQEFLRTGNEAVLEVINFDYVQPEKLTSFEVGYKGITKRKLFLDANVYYTVYKDFITGQIVRNINPTTHRGNVIPTGSAWSPTFNSPVNIQAYGFTVGAEYAASRNWRLSTNYTYNNFNIDEDKFPGGFQDFDIGFNTPTSKINFGVVNKRVVKNLSFGANYRWQNDFYWFGSFGEGAIPAYGILDAQFSLRIPSAKTTIKLGATNITKTQFITNYGGPTIGRMTHLTITYDQFSN
ncbi:MAG TPA: carboxypeptidase-like regulatory domain-containing protein [Saprospiraceae bacterium]|nr:carboxypeptidase-like regulatory domain-containing protein [Saprospiraceae bacterium]